MKKILVGLAAAGMVMTGATAAHADTNYTGVVFAVSYDSNSLNPYMVGLLSHADRWFYMFADTQIYRCGGAGVPDGNLINMNNLNKLKNASKKIRIDYYTYYRDTITCL